MNILRNTFAVLLGLAVAMLIITLGIRMFPQWVTFDQFTPFETWNSFLKSMNKDQGFFWFLLLVSGIASTVGGVCTAVIVKYAKVAYAILIGFMMLFLAMLDVILFPHHPPFYKICIFLTFFPFSWRGGKIVKVFYDKKRKRKLKQLKKN